MDLRLPDPTGFDPREADPELAAMNEGIIAMQKAKPDPWSVPLDVVRRLRSEGRGTFPVMARDPDAVELSIPGRGGTVPVRVFRPSKGVETGSYLHIHGGGWVFGSADENDPRLRRLAEETGLVVISVDYRLAPEHPFPAAPDDCEDVALALARGTFGDLPRNFLAIGGESAGAHLAVLTLLRLRDNHRLTPFAAANLVAGCYDLSLTPSVRRFGSERLILNTHDVQEFVTRFVPTDIELREPSVSPLYADLADMPAALFTCGTRDLLLDDTLFMAARWATAGNRLELSLPKGGCHVFQAFPSNASDRSLAEMEEFLRRRLEERG